MLEQGAAEPVHMVVSESWVVYSYWSAASQRTEISTLSLYEGMIDKYGLSPFNRVSVYILAARLLVACVLEPVQPSEHMSISTILVA